MVKGEDSDEDKDNKRKLEILTQINECRAEISDIENTHQYIYDQTAEVKARNKTILWWVLSLAHRDVNGKINPIFNGEDTDERLDLYDKMEEEADDFTSEFLKKLAYYVSYWYVSKSVEKEDFVTVERLYNQTSDYVVIEDEEEKSEEEKPEEPQAEEPQAEEPQAEEPQS